MVFPADYWERMGFSFHSAVANRLTWKKLSCSPVPHYKQKSNQIKSQI